MIRLAVISHALCQEVPRKRWRLLAERYPVEVNLIVPRIWRSSWLREEVTYRPEPCHEGRFSVTPIPTTSTKDWFRYFFLSPGMGLSQYKPHIIYTVHEEPIWVHQQVITFRNLWSPSSKMIFFSMNALGMKLEKWHQRLRWKRVRDNYDAAIVHYPGCLKSLKGLGYQRPVYLQTQIGVDSELYRPDQADRELLRAELGLTDRFVIGFAGRVSHDKGIFDLLEALPLEDINWSLLVVGDGADREKVQKIISDNGWGKRVRMTGPVPQDEVARYMRTMDCLVLGSRTLPDWIDTFPNVTVQAMACGVPVIGSDSGAIPFQLGSAGLIFSEGDAARLREHLITLGRDPGLREQLAEKGRGEALNRFGIHGLNEGFYDIMQQVLTGNHRESLEESDMRRAW